MPEPYDSAFYGGHDPRVGDVAIAQDIVGGRGGNLVRLLLEAWNTASAGKSVAVIVLELPAPRIERILRGMAVADGDAISVRRIKGACYKFRGGGTLELKAVPKQLCGQATHFIVDNPHD